jgi:putative transposase
LQAPCDWPWSSYRAAIGETERPVYLTCDWLLSQFGGTPASAASSYRAFVEGTSEDDPWQELRAGIYLGSERFVARHVPRKELSSEIPFEQRVPLRPPLSEILTEHGPEGILRAYTHGYRLHEIAQNLGVHTSTVSRRLRALESAMCECKT